MDIIIRNIPENMIDKLDNIAKAEDLSRNALLTKTNIRFCEKQ